MLVTRPFTNEEIADRLEEMRHIEGVKFEHSCMLTEACRRLRGLPGSGCPTTEWAPLTDDDRDRAFHSLPDMLEGFMKKWGWLHFAKAIEDICREKNQPTTPLPVIDPKMLEVGK